MTESELKAAMATSKNHKTSIYFEVSTKFNLKISETVNDILTRLQDKKLMLQTNEMENMLHFQALDLYFVVNTSTGRPELCGIRSSCFEPESICVNEDNAFEYKQHDAIS